MPNRKVKPYHQEVEIRTAHDVRKLTCCVFCTGMGRKDHMIPLGEGRRALHIHGRCYVAQNGLKAILALPKDVTDNLTIGDIGGAVMKALLDKHYARRTHA